jgi:hypothetical protein
MIAACAANGIEVRRGCKFCGAEIPLDVIGPALEMFFLGALEAPPEIACPSAACVAKGLADPDFIGLAQSVSR